MSEVGGSVLTLAGVWQVLPATVAELSSWRFVEELRVQTISRRFGFAVDSL